MYLSQLMLNPRSRQVQREIAGRYELHRTLMRAFPKQLPAEERVLYRLESCSLGEKALPCVLLQSQTCPEWSNIGQNHYFFDTPQIKEFLPQFKHDQEMRFRLLANPTMKRRIPGEAKRKRVGLYMEKDQLAWLDRKAEAGGFRVLSVAHNDRGLTYGRKHNQETLHKLKLLAIQFDGILIVEDPGKFLNTLKTGIGSGKGFGFGLLSLAPSSG